MIREYRRNFISYLLCTAMLVAIPNVGMAKALVPSTGTPLPNESWQSTSPRVVTYCATLLSKASKSAGLNFDAFQTMSQIVTKLHAPLMSSSNPKRIKAAIAFGIQMMVPGDRITSESAALLLGPVPTKNFAYMDEIRKAHKRMGKIQEELVDGKGDSPYFVREIKGREDIISFLEEVETNYEKLASKVEFEWQRDPQYRNFRPEQKLEDQLSKVTWTGLVGTAAIAALYLIRDHYGSPLSDTANYQMAVLAGSLIGLSAFFGISRSLIAQLVHGAGAKLWGRVRHNSTVEIENNMPYRATAFQKFMTKAKEILASPEPRTDVFGYVGQTFLISSESMIGIRGTPDAKSLALAESKYVTYGPWANVLFDMQEMDVDMMLVVDLETKVPHLVLISRVREYTHRSK